MLAASIGELQGRLTKHIDRGREWYALSASISTVQHLRGHRVAVAAAASAGCYTVTLTLAAPASPPGPAAATGTSFFRSSSAR
jgi:hypothetical protein